LTTKRYEFLDEHQLFLSWWFQGSASRRVSKGVSWDPNNTTILSAKLNCSIWNQYQTHAKISFNGEQALYTDATWGDRTASAEVDVSGPLVRGKNDVLIELWRTPGSLGDKTGVFSAYLLVEYEGIEPGETTSWWDKIVDWWNNRSTIEKAGIIGLPAVIILLAFFTSKRR